MRKKEGGRRRKKDEERGREEWRDEDGRGRRWKRVPVAVGMTRVAGPFLLL